MDLYLTSPDWVEFSYSRKIEKIERIKIGLFSYLHATMVDQVKNYSDESKSKEIILTTSFHFIRTNYISRLPLELNVFAIKIDKRGELRCGMCLAKGVSLHFKD